MNTHEEKFYALQKKKRYRSRRNPKQRKYRKRKQKKCLQMPHRVDLFTSHICAAGRSYHTLDYGQSFWNNYMKVMEWQSSCMEGYWKQQAWRLQLENNTLKERLQQISRESGASLDLIQPETFNSESDNNQDEPSVDSQPEFEVTEEFMKFIETSLKHKESTRKKKKKSKKEKDEGPSRTVKQSTGSSEEDSTCEAPEVDNGRKRNEEMKLLYGVDSPKIHGMETAMHLSFMRKCDRSKPIMWPVVPLCHGISKSLDSNSFGLSCWNHLRQYE